ncbi:MAG: M42 family peptidase [Candidatus Aenigmatarchaeota archaeon]
MVDIKLLTKLMNARGVSGEESHVREIILKEIKCYVSDCKVDNAGNLIAHIKGKSPRVMLAAHMDEIGLMVSNIESDGKIRFSTVGGIESISLIGERVHISTKSNYIQGIITTNEISDGNPEMKVPKADNMYVDTGLTKDALKKLGVKIGSYLTLMQENIVLGDKNIVCGKALDDRVGCYILIDLIKRCSKKTKCELYFVFTVQEEIGIYGAKTSAYSIAPAWALAVDTTAADDSDKDNATRKIGGGPCITIKDAELLGNRCLNNWIEKIAKKIKVPVQYDVSDIGTTDALTISLSRGGVPSSVLSIPVRNVHSTYGIADTRDIDSAVKILAALLKNPPKVCAS